MIDLKEYILLHRCILYHQCETITRVFRQKIQTQSINSESSLIDVGPKKKHQSLSVKTFSM